MIKKTFIFMIFIILPNISYSWTFQIDSQIIAITLWESAETNPMYFKRSDQIWCYVPGDQKNLHALIYMLYTTGNKADIHCYDKAESIMGGISSAHKLHRIIAKKI